VLTSKEEGREGMGKGKEGNGKGKGERKEEGGKGRGGREGDVRQGSTLDPPAKICQNKHWNEGTERSGVHDEA